MFDAVDLFVADDVSYVGKSGDDAGAVTVAQAALDVVFGIRGLGYPVVFLKRSRPLLDEVESRRKFDRRHF